MYIEYLKNGTNLLTFDVFYNLIYNINKYRAYTEYHIILYSTENKNENGTHYFYFSIDTKQYMMLRFKEENQTQEETEIKNKMSNLLDSLRIQAHKKAYIEYGETNFIKSIKIHALIENESLVFNANNTKYQYRATKPTKNNKK